MGRNIWAAIVVAMLLMIGIPFVTGMTPLYRMVDTTGFSPLNKFGASLAPYVAVFLLGYMVFKAAKAH